MLTAGQEALAGLQLLVAVARAQSAVTSDERFVITEALGNARLPYGISARALIDSSSDVDALIAQITSPAARDLALGACASMANAGRRRIPQQQAILGKMERAWTVPDGLPIGASAISRATSRSAREAFPTPRAETDVYAG